MTQEKPEFTLSEITKAIRKKAITERLIQFDGNRKKTAESLDISRQQLQNLIKEYEILVPPPLRYRSKNWFLAVTRKKSKDK